MKDPAFLFYSKDFYEGTRTMLPEERACYVDLMIYQHQNGPIPTDLKRVLLYCNGIDKATLEATLQAKFEQTDKGWLNRKLEKVTDERNEFSKKQSVNGTVGQFWKKSKAILNKKDYTKLRAILSDKNNAQVFEIIKGLDISEAMLKQMLLAKLEHLANEDANAIAIEDIVTPEKEYEKKRTVFTTPTIEQVTDYCIERNNEVDPQRFIDHYTSNGWMVGKNKMKDWKAAVRTWENKSNNYATNQRTNRPSKDYNATRANRK